MEPTEKEIASQINNSNDWVELRACPICGSKNLHPRISLTDYSISHEKFNLVTCGDCSFVMTNPRPANHNLAKYYESDAYISHSATRKGIINKLYHRVQKFNLSLKYKAISKFVPRGTWMDYGAGNGAFLSFLKEKSISVVGFEPDEEARAVGAKKGVTIFDSESYFESDKEYAAITMWHVLEHVADLNEILEAHFKHLQTDGILTVAVPNHLSYDARYYKNFWAAYDVPRHLWHFSEKNIKTLISKKGFEHIKTTPMLFDSYYVSMLSEKYKKGSILRGAMLGLLSNFYARVSGYPFSSQIYIFRKINH